MSGLPRLIPLRLGPRLALLTTAIGLLVVPLLSGYYVIQTYHGRVATLERQLDEIVAASHPALREALWLGDSTLVGVHLAGLKNFRGMALVQLDAPGKPSVVVGARPAPDVPVVARQLAIQGSFRGQGIALGTLTLVVSLEGLRAGLRHEAWLIVLAQVTQVAIVAGLILFGYHRLAGRRLRRMAEFLSAYRQGDDRRRVPLPQSDKSYEQADELDQLAFEFNALLADQERSLREMRQANASLTEEIAARADAERALRDARDLAEASTRELEEFSYSISHDMRTPLRAIDGFSKLLIEEQGEKLGGEGQRMLNVVRDNAQRMGQLIDDILRFLRIGRRRMECDSLDMAQLAREAFADLEAAAPSRRLRLEVGALPEAWGDREMIRQVLANLLSNALKFSPLDVEAVIEVGGAAEAKESIYYVKDRGVGFDMRYVDKLFKVFERVHATGQYEGTGVGLAIVKRIIERHGGRAWAEGSVGAGATFYFSLPHGARRGG